MKRYSGWNGARRGSSPHAVLYHVSTCPVVTGRSYTYQGREYRFPCHCPPDVAVEGRRRSPFAPGFPNRPLRPSFRRAVRVAGVMVLTGVLMVSMVAGQAVIPAQSRTPTAQTTTPSPTPLTTVTAQSANAVPSVALPSGIPASAPRVLDGLATTSVPQVLPALSSRRTATSLTNTQPSGSIVPQPQQVNATSRNTAPAGSAAVASQPIGALGSAFRPPGASGTDFMSTWYPGSFNIDTNGDGIVDTVSYVMIDLDSGGTIDRIELSSDDGTFGQGDLGNSATGSGDDELFNAGFGGWPSTSKTITLGSYAFLITFVHAVGLNSLGYVEAATWFEGSFSVNVDASASALITPSLEAVSFALVDTDSNGLFDTMDISTDDTTFGETASGTLGDGRTGAGDDERITISSLVRLGAYYSFLVEFDNNPPADANDARITSRTWGTGSFTVDADADGAADDSASFALTDRNSKGVYEDMDLSTDGASYGTGSLGNALSGTGDDERIQAPTWFSRQVDSSVPGFPVQGVLRDAAGAPLAARTVYLTSVYATTNTQGAYTMTAQAGSYGVRVVSSISGGQVPSYFDISTTSFSAVTIAQSASLDLTIPLARRVTVQVRDSAGNAVANAWVSSSYVCNNSLVLETTLSGPVAATACSSSSGNTNAAGNVDLWLFPSPSGSSYTLTASPLSASGLARGSVSGVSASADTTVTITVPQAVTVTGVLRDGAGNPLLSKYISLSNSTDSASANTNTSGAYSMPVATGSYQVGISGWASTGGNVPKSFNLYSTSSAAVTISGNATLDLTVDAARRVTVRVRDAAGNPVANAQVSSSRPWVTGLTLGTSLSGPVVASGSSSSSGATVANGDVDLWLFPTSAGTSYTLTADPAAGSGYVDNSVSGVTFTTDTTVTITLSPTFTVSGVVRDGAGSLLSQVSAVLSNGSSYGAGSTDGLGAYSLAIGAGDYGIQAASASAAGGAIPNNFSLSTVSLSAVTVAGNMSLDLTIDIAKRVTVRVRDEAGNPVPNATVSSSDVCNGGLTLGATPRGYLTASGCSSSSGITNGAGNVDLWLFPTPVDGSYDFYALATGGLYAMSSVSGVIVTDDTTVTITVTLARAAAISIAAPDAGTVYIGYYSVFLRDFRLARSFNGGATWAWLAVDQAGDVGQFASITAPSPRVIMAGYYDATNGDLKFARSGDAGDTWAAQPVDQVGDVGQYTSIAALDDDTVFINYYDTTNGDLKLARSTNAGGSWTVSTIDGGASDVGQYSAIAAVAGATAGSHRVYVAYYDATATRLRLAVSTDSGVSFTPSVVDPTANRGRHASIAVRPGATPTTDTLSISYLDAGAATVRVATSSDSGSTWSLTSAAATNSTLQATSTTVPPAGDAAFTSYFDGTARVLESRDNAATWLNGTVGPSSTSGTTSITAPDSRTVFVAIADTATWTVWFASSANTVNVRLGPNYTFGVTFDRSSHGAADEARITAATHFTGSMAFDVNGDGFLTGLADTVFFDLLDTTSDGLYDLLGLSVGDATLRSGNPGDGTVNAANDELLTGATVLRLGVTYSAQATFDSNPPSDSSDIRISLAVNGVTPVAYSGTWLIDADGDRAATDTVFFALYDSTTDGLIDAIDISIGDAVFGEGDLGDSVVDFAPADNANDERVALSQIPRVVKLGVHNFQATFASTAGRISSLWYTGAFSIDVTGDGIADSLPFVALDPNSDGLFTVVELDADANATYAPSEIHAISGGSISLGGGQATLTFSANPALTDSVVVSGIPPPGPASAQGRSFLVVPVAQTQSATQGLLMGLDAFDPGAARMPIPMRALEPAPQRVTHDVSGQPVVADEIVVRLDPNLADPDRRIRQIAWATGGAIVGSVPETNTYQVQYALPDLQAMDALIDFVRRQQGVIYAAHHYLVDLKVSRTPNDVQWADPDPDSPITETWNLEYIRAPAAWSITSGSRSVPVAVIDADLDRGHEDLEDNVQSSWGNRTLKARGHGTHVAGAACADGDNGFGVSGVTWACGLRLYDFGGVSAVRAQEAMVRAVDEGARIVNMSIQWIDNNRCGALGTSATLKKTRETNAILSGAIDYARRTSRDVLWVFAAGNECRDAKYASPASLVWEYPENVLVVGAIDHSGGLSPFSNWGETVVVAAPGSDILSTLPGNDYGEMSGTSMATPHVTGLAALVRAAHPAFSAAQVKQCIVRGTREPIPGYTFRTIDALDAVACGSISDGPSGSMQGAIR